jgi:hypothetical protein
VISQQSSGWLRGSGFGSTASGATLLARLDSLKSERDAVHAVLFASAKIVL